MFIGELKRFVQNGWSPSTFSRYYCSPNKLYTTTFAVPPVLSSDAASAFGEPPDDERTYYCVALHYKGELVHHEDIRFRFWGLGSEALVVAVDGEIVLNAHYPRSRYGWPWDTEMITPHWQSSANESDRYPMHGLSI